MNMVRWVCSFFFILRFFEPSDCYALQSIEDENLSLNPAIEIHLQEDNRMIIDEIKDAVFLSREERPLALGLWPYPVWLRVKLKNPTDRPLTRVLSYEFHILDELDFYRSGPNGLINIGTFGNNRPLQDRFDLHYSSRLNFKPYEETSIYIRIKSRDTIQLPLTLRSLSMMEAHLMTQYTYHGVYAGLIIAMIIYNSFLAIRLKERSYGYYVSFAMCVLFVMVSIIGYGRYFFWPDAPQFNRIAAVLFANLGFLSALNFSASFFSVKTSLKSWAPYYRYMNIAWIFIIGNIITRTLPYSVTVFIGPILLIPTLVLLLSPAIIRIRKGDLDAKYFLIAWACAGIGTLVTSFSFLGILDFEDPLRMAQIGLLAELVILSVAMALQLNEIRKNKLKDQGRLNQTLRSHRLAQTFQGRLWSQERIPESLKFQWYNQMADQTGGDWYGCYFDEKRERLVIGLGDVSGHGILSAIVTAELTASLRLLVDDLGDCPDRDSAQEGLKEIGNGLNKIFPTTADPKQTHMTTLSLILVDLKRQKIYYLNGGHLPFYLIHNKTCRPILAQGNLLGLTKAVNFGFKEVEWQAGATLLVYTDGLIENEGKNGQRIKAHRLAKSLAKAQDPDSAVEVCVNERDKVLQNVPPVDDTSILAFQIPKVS